MRAARAALVAGAASLAACSHAVAPSPARPQAPAVLPRLVAPAAIDPAARGAAYLDAIALQLQPGWSQFLDDCRVRLPATHALNVMTRAADVELAIDAAGRVEIVAAPASGDADFDRAVRGVIADAAPLPVPPIELRSDDDRAHLRWLFARDRRQAGPATAAIVDVELPLAEVVAARLAAGELARAAGRLARAPASDGLRTPTARELMTAVLREALGSADGAVQRAAVIAIGRAHVVALAADVRGLLAPTQDTELRRAALATTAALADPGALASLRGALAADLRDEPALVLDDVRALVAIGRATEVAAILAPALAAAPPNDAAIRALSLAPDPARVHALEAWLAHGDARTRAAACAALAVRGTPRAAVVRGLGDPDAIVRAACATAVRPLGPALPGLTRALQALLRDRDDTVRAAAVTALVAGDPAHVPTVAADPAAGVRAALATALAATSPTGASGATADATLRTLASDRDADVRAAAFGALAARGDIPAELAAGVAGDPSPRVRLAAAPGIADVAILAQLIDDPDPRVASEALVRRAAQVGADAALAPALARIAAAPAASADRVRAALAWLLAR